MNFWGRAGAGVLVVAEDTGRVLFNLRSAWVNEPRTWGVWGGSLEEGENPPEAAMRELWEEAGYDGPLLSFEPLSAFHREEFSYWTYLAIVPHEFEPVLDWESAGSRWARFEAAPHPRHFGLQALLDDPEIRQRLLTLI